MAWDDKDGHDFMRHFHLCWLTSSTVNLYAPRMPVFLLNDLQASLDCFPLEIAVRKGHHRVIPMERGNRSRPRLPLAEDEFEDADGNLFHSYPVANDPQIAMPVLALPTLGRSHNRRPGTSSNGVRWRKATPRVGPTRGKCSKCKQVGHNRRMCSFELGQGESAGREEPIASEQVVHSPVRAMASQSVEVEGDGDLCVVSQVLTPGASNT